MLARAADDAGAADEKAASSIRRPRGLGGRQQGRRAPRAAQGWVPFAPVGWCCQELENHSGQGFAAVVCAELLLSLPRAVGIPSPV